MRIKLTFLISLLSAACLLLVAVALFVDYVELRVKWDGFTTEQGSRLEKYQVSERALLNTEPSTQQTSISAMLGENSLLRSRLAELLMEKYATNVKNGEYLLDIIRHGADDECTCEGEFVYGPLKAENKRRRDLKTFDKLQIPSREPIVMCNSMSPITYVGGGITVEPLHSVRLSGMSVDEVFWQLFLQFHNFDISFTSLKSYGVIGVSIPKSLGQFVTLKGNGSPQMTISFSALVGLANLNSVLEQVQYQSTRYDIELREIVSVRLLDYEFKIHVRIYRQPFPRLVDTSREDRDVSEKVTVVTKTFERYDVVRRLIASIRKYYPRVEILIADDSKDLQMLDGKGVNQYIMPFARGWFAGRNLLVSQVRTKYFLWVDDDFIFTKNTKLEKFVEKFEAPNSNLDLVAGRYENKHGALIDRNYDHVIERQWSEDGYCMNRSKGNYGPLQGFPQCNRTDEVTNFFMAKTLSVRAFGFDPAMVYSRAAHHEFFWDGLGRLRVASCNDVTVQHFFTHNNSEIYETYRRGGNDDYHYFDRITYTIHKNNMKCFTGMERNIQDLYKFQTT
ncbi:beta-1,4 N-acetylgalactosaminyltransferase 1-like [Ptychodera flava]|uniref:beta-1,4 N-acetylgalactosaminyltransferase 1-like n=1 Tax=Ptychodera flava TaxID=63121 RepID=UPI00396A3773